MTLSVPTRLVAVAVLLACSTQARAQDWDWVVAPYLWMTTIETDLNENEPPVEEETNYSSIIDELNGTFQLHVEGQGDRLGAFGDVLWVSLGSEREGLVADTEADIDASIWDAALVWNVEPARYRGLDLFAGVRHVSLELGVEFDPINPAFQTVEIEADDSYTDFLVGGRYTAELSPKWNLITRVDTSFGDTDGTFNVSGMFAYETEDWGSWAFGYRYMTGELGQDGRDIDLTLHGPVVSYAFGFR